MGKAQKYLGAGRCAAILAELVSVDGKKGHEHDLWFCCPFHAEKTPSAHYDVLGDVFHCFGCQAGGDLIEFYARLNNMDETEGFISFLKTYCPERLGEKQNSSVPAQKPIAPIKQQWVPDAAYIPPQLWLDKAEKNVAECVEALQKNPQRLAQLSQWGIDADTAKICGIGWNDHDRFYSVTSMGLPAEPSKNNPNIERKIYWPVGFVFASFRERKPVKIKVRAEKPLNPELRYFQVYAGKVPPKLRSPYLIAGNPKFKVWVIVETDRDAYLVWAACRGLGIGAMAVGSAGARPDAYAASILRKADLILCALDNDQAGRKFANSFWSEEFPQSMRHPIPYQYGKDVGDAVWPLDFADPFPLDDFYTLCFSSFYLNVRDWVESGIPSHIWSILKPKTVAKQIEQEKQAAPEETAQEVSQPTPPVQGPCSDILLLAEIMRRNRIGLQLGAGIRIIEPEPGWFNASAHNWRAFEHVSSLVFGGPRPVVDLLDSLDDGTVTGSTLLKTWFDAGWRPAGGEL